VFTKEVEFLPRTATSTNPEDAERLRSIRCPLSLVFVSCQVRSTREGETAVAANEPGGSRESAAARSAPLTR
jgi:hypothetical protein